MIQSHSVFLYIQDAIVTLLKVVGYYENQGGITGARGNGGRGVITIEDFRGLDRGRTSGRT